MNNPEHNFDNRIKQALENYQAPYQPDDWLIMQDKLDGNDKKSRPKFAIFPFKITLGLLFVAFAALIGTAGIGFQQWQELPSTASKSNVSSLQENATSANTDLSSAEINSGINQAGFTMPSSESVDLATATDFEPVTDIAPVLTNAVPIQKSQSLLPVATADIRATAPATPVIPVVLQPSDRLPLPATVKGATLPFLSAISGKLIDDHLPETVKELQLFELPELPVSEETETSAPAPQMPPRLPLITLNTVTAADANGLGIDAPVTAGFSTGLMASYRLSKHFKVTTGALFSYKNLQIDYQPTQSTYENSITINDVPYLQTNNAQQRGFLEMNMVEIPLSIQYQLLPTKKISPYVRAGVSAYLPFKNMVSYNRNSNGLFVQTGSNQTILANFPFVPNPRPTTLGNSTDPLLAQPIIEDIENTDIPLPTNYDSPLQSYWVNSQPDYQTNLTATQYVQIENAPGINRPIWDIVHLSLGMNYQINRHWGIMAETQVKGSLLRHRFDTKLPIQLQADGGQRLFTASMQVGVAYSFK